MTVWLFPGQGSQRPGMAAGFSESSALLEPANRILGADLRSLCTNDKVEIWPVHLLQPAIFTTSVVAAMALRRSGAEPTGVLGHSLGDWAALVSAGMIEFEDALRLVDVRGRAMAKAGGRVSSGMAAVLGLDVAVVQEICDEIGQVWVANLNSPSQTVISGSEKSLTRAGSVLLEAGAARVIRLRVPVAAHTPLMEPAQLELEAALESVELKAPVCDFYSTVDAQAHEDPADIKSLLVASVTQPVRFAETLTTIKADGIADFLEVGPSRALRHLVRQVLPGVEVHSIGDDEQARTRGQEPVAASS